MLYIRICFNYHSSFIYSNAGGCPQLTDPENGAVTDNTDYGTQANYICDTGYCLYGNRYRTCQNDGNWTGTDPTCFSESKLCVCFVNHTCKVYARYMECVYCV